MEECPNNLYSIKIQERLRKWNKNCLQKLLVSKKWSSSRRVFCPF